MIGLGGMGGFRDLLQSAGDSYSPLGGIALVVMKVARFVLIAGDYPTDSEHRLLVARPPPPLSPM